MRGAAENTIVTPYGELFLGLEKFRSKFGRSKFNYKFPYGIYRTYIWVTGLISIRHLSLKILNLNIDLSRTIKFDILEKRIF